MAGSRNYKRQDKKQNSRSGGRWGKKSREDPKKKMELYAVKQDEWNAVKSLRPFPSEIGSAFYMRAGARSDKDMVDPRRIAERLDHSKCEAMNRLGRWISVMASSITEGATFIGKYIPELEDVQFKKTGLSSLRSFFDSEAGQTLAQACNRLHVSAGDARSSASVKKALVPFCDFLARSEEYTSACARTAMFSAKAYLLSMNLLDGFALFDSRQRWADELENQVRLMPKKMRGFIQDPEDDGKLLRASFACHLAQVIQADKTAKRRDLSDDESSAQASSSDTGSSDDLLASWSKSSKPKKHKVFGASDESESEEDRSCKIKFGKASSSLKKYARKDKPAKDAKRKKDKQQSDSEEQSKKDVDKDGKKNAKETTIKDIKKESRRESPKIANSGWLPGWTRRRSCWGWCVRSCGRASCEPSTGSQKPSKGGLRIK
ncbi:unnamed protein product, partial [Polarella glacialis]